MHDAPGRVRLQLRDLRRPKPGPGQLPPPRLRAAHRCRRGPAGRPSGARALLVFPQVTFAARDALLPLHLCAFLVAARAGMTVVPVALGGTRQILPDGSWRAAGNRHRHIPAGATPLRRTEGLHA